MITISKHLLIGALLTAFSVNFLCAQEETTLSSKAAYKKLAFFDYRGTNALDVAIGTAVINGDLPDSEFDAYFKIGYKRFITEHINVNITFNKYNVSFKDLYNEGFMSFDLNIEYLFRPYLEFSPFIQAGYGYNASNNFETTAAKAQGAIGVEYIVTEGLGLKLFAEYNYTFTDELDGLIAGESDDTFLRIGLGINLYFGGKKKKQNLLRLIETVIRSNLVE